MIALLFMLTFTCGQCPLTVQGEANVFAVVYWEHESSNPGYRYSYSTSLKAMQNDTADLTCQGNEVGVEWFWIPPTLPLTPVSVKQCGDLEKEHYLHGQLFKDDFETGDTSNWSTVVE